MDGMQEVKCRECGISLGYQDARTPIDWGMWTHNRCPEHNAKSLGMTREAYDMLFSEVVAAIFHAYPEFPNNTLFDDSTRKVRVLRAEIAAGMVLGVMGEFHYGVTAPDG